MSAPIQVGDIAPDFTLQDVNGKPYTLSASLGPHGLLLVFIRGMFCGYCTQHLHLIWKEAPLLHARGINVLVIAVHGPEAIAAAAALAGASVPVLIDHERSVAQAYGLRRHEPMAETWGYPTADLVHPTSILLDNQRIVRWLYVGANASDRPSMQEVLSRADELTAPTMS